MDTDAFKRGLDQIFLEYLTNGDLVEAARYISIIAALPNMNDTLPIEHK